MIWAGPCLFTDLRESHGIIDTAIGLRDIGVDVFRCKLWGGGTTPEKYFPGVGSDGLKTLAAISSTIPVATEVQTTDQLRDARFTLNHIWIGARNAYNYGLRVAVRESGIPFSIKRASNMPVELVYGMYDIEHPQFVIERGVDTIFAAPDSRFAPDLKGVLQIKNERPDIFDRIMVDCSHSVFKKAYVADVYRAVRAIGVKHFMFECTIDGKSKTDQAHMLSVEELESILKEG